MNTRIRYFYLAALFTCLSVPAVAQDWNRFRGPNGAGQSNAETIPTKWSDRDYDWQIDLPGIGHSSPVISGDKIVITSGEPRDASRYILCLRARDGSQIWSRKFRSTPHRLHKRNSYASSSPAVDGERAYVAWAAPDEVTLAALDLATGKVVWRKGLGPFESQHGFGTSPIVYGDLVIIGNEQLGKSFLIALDRKTGKTKWKCARNNGRKTAYSVPCVLETASGEDQLVFHSTAHGISGIDPATGSQIWSLPDVFTKRCVNSPVVAGGLVFGTCGEGGRGDAVVAVRPPTARGGKPKFAYQIADAAPYVITPVAYGDLLFVWSDRGVASCLDAPTGKVHWRKRVGGNYSGSPVRVGKYIYCIAEDGEVVVLAASKEYRLVARNPLGQRSRATPAVAGGRMYLRTESRLMSLGGKKKS